MHNQGAGLDPVLLGAKFIKCLRSKATKPCSGIARKVWAHAAVEKVGGTLFFWPFFFFFWKIVPDQKKRYGEYAGTVRSAGELILG